MSAFIEQVHSTMSPPVSSPDTPTGSANLPVTSELIQTIDPSRRPALIRDATSEVVMTPEELSESLDRAEYFQVLDGDWNEEDLYISPYALPPEEETFN